ncbi:hypothetical protein [Clostridium folliculivorans]|uniref:Uncharacterized protein n=1 Tax=Clostridium folliculivorans TaxID=2886038 RepID=A0A9W5Y3F3_9CLOT|nr:hypothetical protein [Clostridium folliculivorans]GKU25737.1 hypothetical protein CFOLD11_25630 [Clostridium folliculivorans]GKU28759.1 hypothetical protein CFB3_08650 [Clostridium folliculivorans]
MKKGKLLLLAAASITLIATLVNDKNNCIEDENFEAGETLNKTKDNQ